MRGVYVGLHYDWVMALESEGWPAAENIHIYSTASQAEADQWIEGLEADGITPGWPYGKQAASPESGEGVVAYDLLGLSEGGRARCAQRCARAVPRRSSRALRRA